jgi:hypothetical protein
MSKYVFDMVRANKWKKEEGGASKMHSVELSARKFLLCAVVDLEIGGSDGMMFLLVVFDDFIWLVLLLFFYLLILLLVHLS